jgi:hypothetical protein
MGGGALTVRVQRFPALVTPEHWTSPMSDPVRRRVARRLGGGGETTMHRVV